MFKNCKKFSLMLFVSIFLFSSVKADWITKKSLKTKETIKQEKKQKSEWIKLKKKKSKQIKKNLKKIKRISLTKLRNGLQKNLRKIPTYNP